MILLIVAIIGLSSLLAYETAVTYQSAPSAFRTPSVNYGYYESGGNITVVTYAYDPFGSPYGGLKINFFDNGTEYAAMSDQKGFANISFSYDPLAPPTLAYNYTYQIFGNEFTVPKTSILYSPLLSYSGYSVVPGIISSSNSSNFGLQLLYVGPNGTTAPVTNVYVGTYQNGETSSFLVNNSTYSAKVSGFTVSYVYPTIPGGLLNRTFAIVLASDNGTYLHSTGNLALPIGRLSSYTAMTEDTLESIIFNGIGSILRFLIPLLGIFTAYLTYGKDRTTGVLESVLKRPVTRPQLIASRFLANSVSIALAVVASTAVGDVILNHYLGLYPTLGFSLFFLWTFVVEGLSFLAIMYMVSHLVKSQSALLGIAITAFVVFDLFWSIIPVAVLAAFNISSVSSTYVFANVAFYYASPAGYSNLVEFFYTSHIGFIARISVNPAAYAVTVPLLLIAGILWIMIPFILAYYFARKYD